MPTYDAFLCYSWVDKRRADELRAALVDAGLTVFQDDVGMRDYDHISGRIDAALRSTRVLVALYTPSFPTSEYCRQEMHVALLRSYRLHRSRARVLAVVQGMDIGDVRPARLKHWRLPRTDSDPATVAGSIAGFVHRLRDDDPRRLGDPPAGAEPVAAVPTLPDGVRAQDVRLDADDMDQRIELFEFASAHYDRHRQRSGSDSTDTALAICYLAHATAALDQMDLQFDQAWALIDNAADGLEDDLGPRHPASVAADRVRRWIAALGGDPT
jgi:hypothetical protein